MKTVLMLITLCGLLPKALAQAPQLEITVTKVTNASGTMIITVVDKPEDWMKPSYFSIVRLPVSSTDDVVWVIDDVPAGTYAVSVIQDLNGNGVLDASFLGLPKEPYGFSGSKSILPPKFNKASFAVGTDNVRVTVPLK